jgi:DNA adenine methylase
MLAPWILEHLPEHRTYVEPFGGAASVLLRKPRSHGEVLNDCDSEVIGLFRVARDFGEELGAKLALTPYSRAEFKLSYQKAEDPLEQARRTVVRSFMGFGSNSHCKVVGFRSNSDRSGNTPAMDWRNYPAALAAIVARLQGVVIECRDATQVMRDHDARTTVHYVDPPYVPGTRNPGRDYRHEMTVEQHQELLVALRRLKGTVVLSGYACPLYDRVLRGWRRVTRPSLADGAKKRTEVLWISRRAR